MNSMRDVMKQARKLGVACTERTFWHYHKLGLLPGGQKIPGYGNVIFFPPDTGTRLWLIYILTKKLRFNISDLRSYPWSQFKTVPATNFKLSKEVIFAAKQEFENARAASLRKVVESISVFLTRGETAATVTESPEMSVFPPAAEARYTESIHQSDSSTGLRQARTDIPDDEITAEDGELGGLRRVRGG